MGENTIIFKEDKKWLNPKKNSKIPSIHVYESLNLRDWS